VPLIKFGDVSQSVSEKGKNVKNSTVNEVKRFSSLFHFIEIKTQKYCARKIAFAGYLKSVLIFARY